MAVIILKSSCTPPPPTQSTRSSFHFHHHHSIQCDVSFLSIHNDFVMHHQLLRPCGVDNVLLLTRHHHDNNVDDHDRHHYDDGDFSISLTNCQFDNYDIDVHPSTVRLVNENDVRIGKVEFDLSPMLTEIEGVEGECHANFNTSTSNISHYHRHDKVELMQSINDQMQLLQTALITLGVFGILLTGGFVYTVAARRSALSKQQRSKPKRDGAVVDTALFQEKNNSGVESSANNGIFESSSSVYSTVDETKKCIVSHKHPKIEGGKSNDNKNEQCHETLHLISIRQDQNTGMRKEEKASSSPRQWYEDLLSPCPAVAAMCGDGQGGGVSAVGGEEVIPSRTLFSTASSNNDYDNANDSAMLLPGGEVLSQDHDSSRVLVSNNNALPIESRQLAASISSNADTVILCHEGDRGERNTAVECTEKDDRSESEVDRQLYPEDPQDRLSPQVNNFTVINSKHQLITPITNRHDNIVKDCQEVESSTAAAAPRGQMTLQDKSHSLTNQNPPMDSEEITPVTKNKHDSSTVTSQHDLQEASSYYSLVKSPFSPVSKTTNINFLELAERIEAENAVTDEMSTPLLPRRSGCNVRVVSPDGETGVESVSVADDEQIGNDDTYTSSLRDDMLILSTEQDHDISRDAHFGIPTSVVVDPKENIASMTDKNCSSIAASEAETCITRTQDCSNTDMNARNLTSSLVSPGDNDTSLLDKNREPVDSSSTNDVVPATEQVCDDSSCLHIPKTIIDKCEDDGYEIHSIDDSTSSSASLLVSLNSTDTPNKERDILLHNPSAETVSGIPKENMIPNNDDTSIANSVSSGSLLVSADEDLDSGKEGNEDKSAVNSLSSVSLLVSVDEVTDSGKVGNDDKSMADSLSSASILVSVDGDVVSPKENNENDSSMSSVSLLVSLDGHSNGDCIQDAAAYDGTMQIDMSEPKGAMALVGNLHSNHPSEESSNESIKVEPNDISTHNMKHNVIEELKSSSRFKFKQSGANTASSFADELAVVTRKKVALAESNDFASSLAKCVAEKEHCKSPKKSGRKVLVPLHASPRPQSADTGDSEFLSDYW